MDRLEKLVDGIWKEELALSDIPEQFHGKIKRQVSTSDFLKGGIFDENAFRAAIEAEVRTWGRFFESQVMGCGFVLSRDKTGQASKGPKALAREEEQWVKEMLALAGQAEGRK